MEVLNRPSFGMRMGKRYESKAKIFGWPVVSIAMGPHGSEIRGHVRADRDWGYRDRRNRAGRNSRGVVAIGGLAVGVCAFGGGAVGLISACGGFGISSGIAIGGAAIGSIAIGGGAVGLIAQGGGALGFYMAQRPGRFAGQRCGLRALQVVLRRGRRRAVRSRRRCSCSFPRPCPLCSRFSFPR